MESRATNKLEFLDAIKIVPSRKEAQAENYRRISKLGQPIFRIDCLESSKVPSDDKKTFGYLERTLYLCIGAQVVVNQNILAEKGIYNAAVGTTRNDKSIKY